MRKKCHCLIFPINLCIIIDNYALKKQNFFLRDTCIPVLASLSEIFKRFTHESTRSFYKTKGKFAKKHSKNSLCEFHEIKLPYFMHFILLTIRFLT